MGAYYTSNFFEYLSLVFPSLQHEETSEMKVKCLHLTQATPQCKLWLS